MGEIKIRERIDDVGELLTEKQVIDCISKEFGLKKGYLDRYVIKIMREKVNPFKNTFLEEKGKYSEKRLNNLLREPFAKSTVRMYCENKEKFSRLLYP